MINRVFLPGSAENKRSCAGRERAGERDACAQVSKLY